MQKARRRPGSHGVDENGGVGAFQQFEKIRTRPIGDDYFAIRQRRLRENSRDLQPGGIIAEGAADADDPSQRRSISSLRKCVEQEMHGS
jgi:hypothetical protein